MKTREQIYSAEASLLVRDITTYRGIKRQQLLRFYPNKEDKIQILLKSLVRQGRAFYNPSSDTYHSTPQMTLDKEMLAALWVLSDFGDRAEYHSTDTFPTNIVFFADGQIYEIICMPRDMTALILHALGIREKDEGGKKIFIVESAEQMEDIDFADAVFCTVDEQTGKVRYFKKQ